MVANMNRFKNWKMPEFNDSGYAFICEGDYPNITKRFFGWKCDHNENLKLGNKVDIGCFTYMNARYGIEIGADVQIGSHCSIYSVNTENNTKGKVIIGDKCLIGSHCLILPNAIIPNGSKIRAYSIVKSKYIIKGRGDAKNPTIIDG